MFLRAVVLDGFKSYAGRTTVEGLDRNFTAITGANGAGKSNVIDAIVFALDLDTARKLRVASLKELINAHRRDCSVTITFDNTDTHRSPAGYEHCPAITVTRALDSDGRSKYRMNSHACTRATVEAFSRAAGITSNLVILQGHITRIVNMKSPELRTLVEEAAGTRSYYAERLRAEAALAQKEDALRAARDQLQRSIAPAAARLRQERSAYEARRALVARRTALEESRRTATAARKALLRATRAAALRAELRSRAAAQSAMQGVEAQLAARAESSAPGRRAAVETRIAEIDAQVAEARRAAAQSAALEAQLGGLATPAELRAAQGAAEKLGERERLLEVAADAAEKISELLRQRQRLAGLEAETRQLPADTSAEAFAALQRLGAEAQRLQAGGSAPAEVAAVARLGAACAVESQAVKPINDRSGPGGEGKAVALRGIEPAALEKALAQAVQAVDRQAAALARALPYARLPGVLGTVDEHYEVVDPRYAVAVSVALGARAKYVLCTTDEAAAALLARSERQVSCIPLNKISAGKAAGPAAGAVRAVDAVRYEPAVAAAFQFLLGGWLLFEDAAAAERCCFAQQAMCVTLDGAVFDPRGTVTAGRPPMPSPPVRSASLAALEAFASLLREATAEGLSGAAAACQRRWALEEAAESARENIATLERLCGDTAAGTAAAEELKDVRKALAAATQAVAAAEASLQKRQALEEKIREAQKIGLSEGGTLAALAVEKENLKAELQALSEEGAGNAAQESLRVFEEQREELIKEVATRELSFKRLYKQLVGLLGEKKGEEEEEEGIKESTEEETQALPPAEALMNAEEAAVEEILAPLQRLPRSPAFFEAAELPEGGPWRVAEAEDLHEMDGALPSAAANQIIARLSERITAVKGELAGIPAETPQPPAANALLELHAQTIEELEGKIQQLTTDRTRILKTIERLSNLSSEETSRAFRAINALLGRILRYFLPLSEAFIDDAFVLKVRTVIGGAKGGVFEGGGEGENQVNAGEGTVRENTLDELSGGQRSLIALSLVFSMLAYRPGPFYLFDEVDAALDLNYTQRIGEVMRREFSEAQFIVVSLKESLFGQAPRLFRVGVRDGKAAVETVR